MNQSRKNLILGVIVAILTIAAIAIVAQTVDFLQAIGAILVLVGAGLALTLLNVLLARRSALKNLGRIADFYRNGTEERGERAGQYSPTLLELPVAEQVKMFQKLARKRGINPEQALLATSMLRESEEYDNSLDRVRSALNILLGTQGR